MATIRKRLGRWQSIVRVKGYPARTQSFNFKTDAKLWSSNIELELHREKIINDYTYLKTGKKDTIKLDEC